MARKRAEPEKTIEYSWAHPWYNELMDAENAVKNLEKVRSKYGILNHKNLLDDSRLEGSPFHHFFEWCDKVGAEKWRLHQSQNIINSVRMTIVRIEDKDTESKSLDISRSVLTGCDKIKGYHLTREVVVDADNKPHRVPNYLPFNKVMESEEKSTFVRGEILSRFESLHQQFEVLSNDEIWGPALEAINVAIQKEKLQDQMNKPAISAVSA